MYIKIQVFFFFCHRMWYNEYVFLCLIALVLGQAAALPQHPQYSQQYPEEYQEQQIREDRKFAEKPNAMKKVAIDDLEDISTNQIQVSNLYKIVFAYVFNSINIIIFIYILPTLSLLLPPYYIRQVMERINYLERMSYLYISNRI